ncbi:MAG: KpsF/GutQ family sugar-phosphate isomerase [Chitinophagaceae bacterium]
MHNHMERGKNIQIREIAIKTLELEAAAIQSLTRFINEDFEKAITWMAAVKGRIIITGIGKSAIIAQKIVATLNSTGTPSLFMHAVEAIHGDLGMIQQEDLVLCISKSGESQEIKILIPLLKSFRNPLIAMVGNRSSFLALQADLVLDTTVSQEACPNNLAPTASTTAQLAMGDALAICLMEWKGFSTKDFARLHPGGNLGKRLYLRVKDLSSQNPLPQVKRQSTLKEVILEITGKRLGITAVLGEDHSLEGVITDGDLRRMLETNPTLEELKAEDIMSQNPKTIQEEELAIHALDLMRNSQITQLVVLNHQVYCGILHLHDLIKEGIF